MADVFADRLAVQRVRYAVPDAAGEQVAVAGLIGAEAEEAVFGAAQPVQLEVVGQIEEAGEVALAIATPALQCRQTGQTGDVFQRVAEGVAFEKPAEAAQQRDQAQHIGLCQRFGAAAGLQAQRVRPFTGHQAHQMHEFGARRQHVVHRRAGLRLETGFGAGEPGPGAVRRAGEIGHEEQIEMRQMVGQVLAGGDQTGGETAVRRHFVAAQMAQRAGRRMALRDGTDAADARHDDQRIGRRLAGQNLLEAAIHRRVDLRRDDTAIGNLQADFEVAFDAVERADDELAQALSLQSSLLHRRGDDGVIRHRVFAHPLRRRRFG